MIWLFILGIIAGIIQVCVEAKIKKEQAEEDRKQWEATEKERRAKLRQLQKNFYIIDQMDGDDFERFTAELLRRWGFQNVGLTKPSGDYGVDVIAYSHGVKYAIQCKRYSGKLGLKAYTRSSFRYGTLWGYGRSCSN